MLTRVPLFLFRRPAPSKKEADHYANKRQKLTVAGVLVAVGVACSTFSIPVGASRCFNSAYGQCNVGVLLGPLLCVHNGLLHLASARSARHGQPARLPRQA